MKPLKLDRKSPSHNIGGRSFYLYYESLTDKRIRVLEKAKITLRTYEEVLRADEKIPEWTTKLRDSKNFGDHADVLFDMMEYTKVITSSANDFDNIIDRYYDTIWELFSLVMIEDNEDQKEYDERVMDEKITHFKSNGVTLGDVFFFLEERLKKSPMK